MGKYQYEWNTNENQQQRDYDWQKTAQQRQWAVEDYQTQIRDQDRIWQERFNAENEEYNRRILEGPSMQVQGLRAAGVNPAAGFTSGSGLSLPQVSSPSVSVPSSSVAVGGAPSTASSPPRSTVFLDIIQSLRELGQTARDGVMSYDTLNMLGANLSGKLSDNMLKDALVDYQYMANEVYRTFGSKEKATSILRDISESLLAASQGNKEEAMTMYYNSMSQLTDTQNKKEQEALPFISKWWQANIEQMSAGTVKLRQDVRTGQAQEQMYQSQGKYYDAIAATEDALRDWKALEAEFGSRLTKNEFIVADSTTQQRMNKIVNESVASDMLPEQMATALEKAHKENDWYEVNQILGIAQTGIEVYKAKNGGRIADAMDVRNELEDDWYNYQKTHYKSEESHTERYNGRTYNIKRTGYRRK